jgi:hypothetical protein
VYGASAIRLWLVELLLTNNANMFVPDHHFLPQQQKAFEFCKGAFLEVEVMQTVWQNKFPMAECQTLFFSYV